LKEKAASKLAEKSKLTMKTAAKAPEKSQDKTKTTKPAPQKGGKASIVKTLAKALMGKGAKSAPKKADKKSDKKSKPAKSKR
jgi:hypothetical protein